MAKLGALVLSVYLVCAAIPASAQVSSTNRPAHNVGVAVLDYPHLPFIHRDQSAAVGTGFANVPALDVSRENDPWLTGHLLTLVDVTKIHSGGAAAGMYIPGLWEVDAATGAVTTLLASNYDTSTFNLAKYPYLAPDDQLYFFFLASNTGEYSRTPLQLVRSAPDGVTDRTVVREESV